MKINLIAAGKIKNSNLIELINNYLIRLKTFKINIIEIDDRNLSKSIVNQKLFAHAKPTFTIVLDETGKTLTSSEFSQLLFSATVTSHTEINFVIGGSEGIDKSYLATSNLCLSLGKITLPHQLARLILVEQIYRAESIYFNHPYHRE
ncbi:23S rRNA (pseudouridine(1915)-N(3))-methyltransferase RlmH [Rickettsiales bacterium LUAb2]